MPKKSKKVVPPAVPEDFSIFELAEAHLAMHRVPDVSVAALVGLLIDQAVSDDAEDQEEDAGKYALLAAQLITAFKLEIS
jgi:hypothetical protein